MSIDAEPRDTVQAEFIAVAKAEFTRYKELAEQAFSQLDEADFFFRPDEESNSIFVIVKHLAGNMRSRWTDFLTTDGEKPDRHRDGEFVEDRELGREEILSLWEAGWRHVFDALSRLEEDDLLRVIYIRREPHSALRAIARQLAHYADHVGQIVYLAKHIKGGDWISLSIPKGKSEEYLREH
ncbi:MAG: DUF1572 family protein [Gemmatimonadetes bacterium]|nr:DUF1572 family protein [Gemmatimonadota bacterium]